MTITIIGLGLIGGSIALDLKSQLCLNVIGVDANNDHRKKALELNLVDEIMGFDQGIKIADIIIIATPVDIIEDLLPKVLNIANPKSVVTDVGSTKKRICDRIINHPNRGRFVAAHPLAGTEFSGPEAALKGLFVGKKNIICDKTLSDNEALNSVEALFASIGMITYFMNSEDHDRHLAYVSHLSHITSFALGLTVLNIEKDEKQILNLAGTGFESTARLAKSNPETWAAIFNKNQEYLIEALDGYIKYLNKFKNAVESDNLDEMKILMKHANGIKKILGQKSK